MSSIVIECVRFTVYPNDHPPRHIHGFHSNTIVVVDILANGNVRLAERKKAIRPKNAKKSDVKKVLDLAAEHFEELKALWEKVHGKA